MRNLALATNCLMQTTVLELYERKKLVLMQATAQSPATGAALPASVGALEEVDMWGYPVL